MTEYTDEADQAIQEAPRQVRAGDMVSHVDDPLRELGHVFSLNDDGTAAVYFLGQGVRHGIPVERLKFRERPEAFASIEFNGYDDVDDAEVSYAFVHIGSPVNIAEDIAVFGKTEGYTIMDSFVPSPETDQDTDVED